MSSLEMGFSITPGVLDSVKIYIEAGFAESYLVD